MPWLELPQRDVDSTDTGAGGEPLVVIHGMNAAACRDWIPGSYWVRCQKVSELQVGR